MRDLNGEERELLPMGEAAKKVGVSPRTLTAWVSDRRLRVRKQVATPGRPHLMQRLVDVAEVRALAGQITRGRKKADADDDRPKRAGK